MIRTRTIFTGLFLSCAMAGTPAMAQYGGPVPVSDIDPAIFQIDETRHLGTKVSLDVSLIDEQGREFTLADKLGKPTILVLSYYTCDGSCSVINQDLKTQLEGVTGLKVGEDFNVVTASFDKADDLEKLGVFKQHLKVTKGMDDGWTFATFKDPEQIKPFTDSIGFKYFWSPQDRQFYHPGAFLFLTPEGRLARVLYALSTEPKDVKLAILDAKAGEFKPSEVVNYAVSLCYSYNYAEGKYTLNIPLFVGAGSLSVGITAFAVSVFVFRRRRMREVS